MKRELDYVDLLGAILRGVPKLPKALCRGQIRLFDADDPNDVERENQRYDAAKLCSRCPELDPCSAWVDSLPPSRRPAGVVAGHVPSNRSAA
jgi:hypothetical protein